MSRRPSPSADPSVDWLVAFIIGGAVVLLSVVVAGLVAALSGWMAPLPVALLGVAGIGALGYLLLGGGDRPHIRWKTPAAVAAVAGVLVAFTVIEMRFAAEHLLTDRDPGVYVTAARWLAGHGTLLVDGAVGAFSDVPGVDGMSQGYYAGRADGLLYVQFQHGLAVAMAVGRWIGGDRLLLSSVGLLSGGALAAFYAFTRTVLRPCWALAATTGVTVNLVAVHFGRDAYSESLLMIFLFSGLWLLDRALRSGRWTGSLLAGLMLGGTALVRIDAWLALAGVVAFLFVDVWSAGDEWQRRVRSVAVPVAGGIMITGGLGVVDLLVASPEYLSDLMPNVYRVATIMGIVIVVGLLASVAFRPWRRVGDRGMTRGMATTGTVAATLIVLGAGFLFFVRPVLLVERSDAMVDVVEYYQRLQGLPLDGTRRYWEMSMHWLAWYLGIGGLTVGVAGWAWATREAFMGRLRRAVPFLLIFSIVTVAFLWRPANSPDQIWMMRRFVTVTIPGFVLLAFLLVQYLIPVLEDRWRRVVSVPAAAALTAVMIIPPAAFTGPLVRSTTQVGMYGVTREVCSALGDDAAVLVVNEQLRLWYEPALRAFCEIPVAGAAERPSLETLVQLGSGWAASGRELFVVSLPADECGIVPVFSEFIWYPQPERTLTRRPSAEVELRFGIAVYRASDFIGGDPGAWSRCVDPR